MKSTTWLWWVWGIASLAIAGYLGYRMFSADATVFTPGTMTHAHHQIELLCDSCHSKPFGGDTVIQEACVKCHGDELKQSDDKHPKSKFTDPRNAARVAKLDATRCVSCHTEHRPEITHAMGVTQPNDFCQYCHADIAEDRPSHAGMAFDTCAASGCHKFHDNRALYEDFIAKHLAEPSLLTQQKVPALSRPDQWSQLVKYPLGTFPLQSVKDPDHTAHRKNVDPKTIQEWQASAHARSGVNCTACHLQASMSHTSKQWLDKPDHTACKDCHTTEVKGFLSGMHGMRLASGLPAMTPAEAQIPMQADAKHQSLGCSSCHGAHGYPAQRAATEACLGCHADKHSEAFKASTHYRKTQDSKQPITCATCHLPRVEFNQSGSSVTLVQHNQNDNLRPNEKMVREVCMNCHGYDFTINSLADPALIQRNFTGQPDRQNPSSQMVKERLKTGKQKSAGGGAM